MANVIVSGAGSNGAAEEGALSIIKKVRHIDAIAGVSAGAINAVAIAAGINNVDQLWEKFLTRGDLEDWHLPGPLRPLGILRSNRRGMMAGNKMHQAMTEVLGNMRMCDLTIPCRVVVGNLWKRKIQVVDSQLGLIEMSAGGKVKVINKDARYALCTDTIRCSSAVPGLIDAWPLLPEWEVLFTDGGTGANVPVGIWDDLPRETIVVKFHEDETERPVKTIRDFVSAMFDLRQDAANSAMASVLNSDKIVTVDIPSPGNAMDFSLKKGEPTRRRKFGINAAKLTFGLQ